MKDFLFKLGVFWQKLQAIFYRFFGQNYSCGCGHTAKWKTILTIDGVFGVFELHRKDPECCPQCFAGAVIKCVRCGKAILPDDPITLYASAHEDFEVPEHAVVYREKPELLLIGCLRRSCADLIDRYGFWVMPGKVQRAMSVTEMVEAGGDDEIVHINDVCDISEATLLPDE